VQTSILRTVNDIPFFSLFMSSFDCISLVQLQVALLIAPLEATKRGNQSIVSVCLISYNMIHILFHNGEENFQSSRSRPY
jgi:hypothetical protein